MISSDFEDRLREEMHQFTAGALPSSGLVRRARRARRRRLTTRAAATATTAAAVAVAAAVTTGAVGAPRDTGIHTTAYVVTHVESALGTAVTADDIAHLRITGTANVWYYSAYDMAAGMGLTYSHAPGGFLNVWLYNGPRGMITRTSDLSSHGQFYSDLAESVTSTGTMVTVVSYPAKAWSRSTGTATPPHASPSASCSEPVPVDVSAYYLPVLTSDIRQALACGQLTNEGTERVNGVDAIKLVSVNTLPQPEGGTITTTTTLWVDSANYLPVRWQVASASAASPRPATQGPVDITWLPPTSANLAQLTLPIPEGFARVRAPAGSGS